VQSGGASDFLQAIAFANIGLSRAAFRGSRWAKDHRPTILTQILELLSYEGVIGICLGEVGGLDEIFDRDDQIKFEEVLQAAFAGAAEHGPAQIFWPEGGGETVSAWREDVQVHVQPTMRGFLTGSNSYRSVERFVLTSATKHGPVSTLVFNSHQPASEKRQFKPGARQQFCKALLVAGIAEHERNSANVGFIAGGDINCSRAPWSVALEQTKPDWCKYFEQPTFVFSTKQIAAKPWLAKAGDCHVTMGRKNFNVLQCDCTVKNRDPGHDCIIVRWESACRIDWAQAANELKEQESHRRGAAEQAAREEQEKRSQQEHKRQRQEEEERTQQQEKKRRQQEEEKRRKKDEEERQRQEEERRQQEDEQETSDVDWTVEQEELHELWTDAKTLQLFCLASPMRQVPRIVWTSPSNSIIRNLSR